MKFDEIFLPAFFMLFVPGGKFCADSDDNKTESVRWTEMGENLWYVRQSLKLCLVFCHTRAFCHISHTRKKRIFLKTAETQFYSYFMRNFALNSLVVKLFLCDEQKWVKICDLCNKVWFFHICDIYVVIFHILHTHKKWPKNSFF